jgi:hypothetical protein
MRRWLACQFLSCQLKPGNAEILELMIASAEEFVRLRTSVNPADYSRAARENAAAAVWLDVIRLYPQMRFWVAQNKTVPASILEALATDADARVRFMIAGKNKLTPAIFDRLARDPDSGIRERIARHKRCPRQILERLSRDAADAVARVAEERLHEAT